MRVAIGGISHESSTFSTVPTELSDFELRNFAEGEGLLERFSGTKTPIGGFIDAARDANFDVVPTMFASATPGGPVTAEATEVLTGKLVDGLRAALHVGPLDGVMLALHGAMVSDLDDDGEGYILREVRKAVRPDLPLIVELDLHGNITQEMVDLCTMPVAYDEYPHIDPYERGYEIGLLMARIVRGGAKPTPAMVKIPILASLQRQFSHAEPMLTLKHMVHDVESERGVLNVSYLPGFAWADIEPTTFSIIVTTDDDRARAAELAAQLGRHVWEHREDFIVRPTPVDDAVRHAMEAPESPIVLADIGDNPGGGAPADGTVLLEALLRLGARNAVVVPINDPESVRAAFEAGQGETVSLRLGAKVDHFHGEPLDLRGRVLTLSDGRFVHRGLMSTGIEMNMGPTAVVEIEGANGGSVIVVVTTHRYQPTDLEVLRSQDIEPTTMQIIAVKSSVHFRAAFMPIAKEVIEVDTPGLTSPRLDRLEFHKIRRPMYPFDPDMTWEP